MDQLATVKMELNISGSRILSQLQTNNQNLEEQISKGIQKALDELISEDNFLDAVVAATKAEIDASIKYAVKDWTFKNKLHQKFAEALDGKIDELAANWAEKALLNLKS